MTKSNSKPSGKTAKIARVQSLGKSRIVRQQLMTGLGSLISLSGGRSFNFGDVMAMLDDDQIALGLEYIKIPIIEAPIGVTTSKPEAYHFACDLYQRIWDKLVPKLDLALAFGWGCLEPLYTKDPKDWRYWDFKDFDIAPPLTSVPWVYNDRLAFAAIDMSFGASMYYVSNSDEINKDTIVLEGAGRYRPSKALWICNDPLLSRWYGRSVLRAAHLRWKAKNMPDGLLESLFKASYKSGFSGLLIRYPAGQSVTNSDGTVTTSEQYADLICQVIKNGSNIRLPDNIKDSPGWMIEEYAKNLVDLEKLQAPLDYVDRGMMRGMGIPDEILTHDGNTGGYSRSMVSVDAFYKRGEARASAIIPSVTEYIVAPLVRQRYGDDCVVNAFIMRQQRPDDDGSGGQKDSDGDQIPDALEGAMRGGNEEGDMSQGPDDGQQQPGQEQEQGPSTKFSIAMSSIAKKHEYSSTQFCLDGAQKLLISKLSDAIATDDLAEKGIEDKPHITVLYGLHTDKPDDVREIVQKFGKPVTVKLAGLSLFKNEDFDVLKIDVKSPDIHRLNRKLAKLSHTNDYPDYLPHLTLAYLQPGEGSKYLLNNPLDGMELTFHAVTFSDKDRNKTYIELASREAN